MTTDDSAPQAAPICVELRKAAQRVVDVVHEQSISGDASAEDQARWYYEWEVRHLGAVADLVDALAATSREPKP